MATAPSRPISNIAMAFAAKSSSVEIPKAREGAGHPLPSGHRLMLPTPPNSISPQLAPQSVRSPALIPGQTAHQPDSDIDLQDAVEHAQAQGHPQALSSAALSGLEVAGAITPSMLARQHLPDILLANGPMAIRHVLGHLTQAVPGFSRIPPAKARRIVVSALEGKTGGGANGDVLFEKVGWGRWDARIRGQPPREGRNLAPESLQEGGHLGVSPPASFAGSYQQSNAGLQIPSNSFGGWGINGRPDGRSGASWAGESMLSSHDEEMDDIHAPEHELMDQMSLDGRDDSGMSSCSGPPEDIPIKLDDPEDATDEEDWAGIGPEALRRASVFNSGSHTRRNYNHLSLPSHLARMKSSPATTSSAMLMKASPHSKMGHRHHSFAQPSIRHRPSPAGRRSTSGTANVNVNATSASFNPGFSFTQGQDAQAREAAEALLSMGSV